VRERIEAVKSGQPPAPRRGPPPAP
jgi:hypothetical protein